VSPIRIVLEEAILKELAKSFFKPLKDNAEAEAAGKSRVMMLLVNLKGMGQLRSPEERR
jgi:hypothetical protein